MPGEPLTGIVLAGGEGRRMGGPKAFLRIEEKLVLDRIIKRIRPACGEIKVVISPGLVDCMKVTPDAPPERVREINNFKQLVMTPGIELHVDPWPDKGPLGGMAAGLSSARYPWCLVTSCDAPLISPRLIQKMRECADDVGDAGIIVPEYQGRLQPLQALYRKDVGKVVWERVQTDRLKVTDLLKENGLRVHTIREAEWAGWGVPETSFTNLNRPEDLRAILDS